ncbi:MAG: DUF1841 family protein [Neisseriaceae bacterium]|nr:DUF1841 family protein [Neisseriaceae bacterium]
MFNVNTDDVRQFFAQAWQARMTTNDALQQKAIRIIAAHPEYHHYLENIERWIDYNWLPENGESNPFLHMSLHLSIQEQVAIDQPFGVAEIHRTLCEKYHGDWVAAEHQMIEALAEMIWQAQRYGTGLDVNAYMTNLRRKINLGEEDEKRLNPHEI